MKIWIGNIIWSKTIFIIEIDHVWIVWTVLLFDTEFPSYKSLNWKALTIEIFLIEAMRLLSDFYWKLFTICWFQWKKIYILQPQTFLQFTIELYIFLIKQSWDTIFEIQFCQIK